MPAPAPAPTPAPTPAPAPAPAPAPETKAEAKAEPKPSEPSRPRCKPAARSYYSCERSYGIFHNSRLAVGGLAGDVVVSTMDPVSGMTNSSIEPRTTASIAFEGGFLGVPSSFAPTNFHGIEFSTGMRLSKFDFWLSFGTAVTFLNLGHGGPGTLRVGGSFGAGFNLAHGYGYIRGRGALVILPERLDVELSAQWTPPSASTGNYDEQAWRVSAWYRLDAKSRRAVEIYVEKFQRVDVDPMVMDEREIEGGVGGGIGMSFF